MIEQQINLWDIDDKDAAICITTNGFVKNSGECVMGRGCAKELIDRQPDFALQLGEKLGVFGNTTILWDHEITPNVTPRVITFPVKHNWWEDADLELIAKSATELMSFLNAKHLGLTKVYLPRPGCGNGKLAWEIVKPIIEGILDDRVIVVTFKE